MILYIILQFTLLSQYGINLVSEIGFNAFKITRHFGV